MKYIKGQHFLVKDTLIGELSSSTFIISDLLEGIEYPYLLKFENDYEISVNEEEIQDIIQGD